MIKLIETKPASARQTSYAKRVAHFIQTNGPLFTLARTEMVDADVCDCCGYRPLTKLFWVKNDAGQEFKIGSECQLFVLGTEGVIPANKLRLLEEDALRAICSKLGVEPGAPGTVTREELVTFVINQRRSKANASGWATRRARGLVPAKLTAVPAEQPTV